MTENLEVCVYKLQVMRLAYVERQMERCRNCNEYTMMQCSKYKSYDPQKDRPMSMLGLLREFYKRNISINGLPHENE